MSSEPKKISAARSAKNAGRPSWKQVLGSPVHLLAFGLGAGLAPRAPGTAGTLVAVPLWYLLSPLAWPAYLGIVAALLLFGCWLCGASARRLGVHDHGGIVFDEIVGFLIACVPLLAWKDFSAIGETVGLVIAFAAFRLFDIWKPWPIAWLDAQVHGGLGIMLDDVLAGVYAALLLTLVLGLAGTWEIFG